MDNLEELMGHIDYFYEFVRSSYDSDREFEVFLKDERWTITDKSTNEVFGTTDHKDALAHMVENKVDLGLLHNMVYDKICTEGVLRRMQLKKVEELIGSEAIDKAETAWDGFAKNLAGVIKKELNKPNLELV